MSETSETLLNYYREVFTWEALTLGSYRKALKTGEKFSLANVLNNRVSNFGRNIFTSSQILTQKICSEKSLFLGKIP